MTTSKPPQKVRFKVAWRGYRVGHVIEPPALLRGWLVARGYCEAVAPEGEEEAEAAAAVVTGAGTEEEKARQRQQQGDNAEGRDEAHRKRQVRQRPAAKRDH